MTTAWQHYIQPIEEANAAEETPHSWDAKVDSLRARDLAEEALQAQLQRAGSDLNMWEMPNDSRHHILQLLAELQSYPEAVTQFLRETAKEASRCQ